MNAAYNDVLRMRDEKTYNMQPSLLAARGIYRPLRFRIGPPAKTRVRAAASLILASYFGQTMTFTRWRDAEWLVMRWLDPKQKRQLSLPFNWAGICDHLRDQETFVPTVFNFPNLISGWLDSSIEVPLSFHAPASDGTNDALTFQLAPAISAKFPIQPLLDREGRAFTSLQLMLLESWFQLRSRLVERSEEMFEGLDWLRDLFMYLNTVVSSVDNTLHQLYYRAKYESAELGWSFDEAALGSRYGRRLVDKLRWVAQITGKPLDDCEVEIESFAQLKRVRNHMAHFDPPVLAFTIEDVADWLNSSEAVAKLLVAIRRRLGEPLCVPLVSLLLARPVDWYPSDPGRRRVPQPPNVGYASSCAREDLP